MSRYTFPRNLSKQRAMMRISIHQRKNELTDVNRELHSTQTVLSRIYLYMPQSVQINDGLTYENVDLSNLLSTGQDVANAVSNGVTGNDVNTDSIVTSGLNAAQGSGGIIGGAASQALIRTGRVLNPRTQMLFKGPVLRQFSFQFKFIPSNRDEAEDIYNMIQEIRAYSYPSVSGITEGGESTFTFPDIFRLEFVRNPTDQEYTSGGNSDQLKLIRLADTYCTAISTNYNPTSPTFHAGGYPSEVDLSLTFQETKVVTRSDILDKGF